MYVGVREALICSVIYLLEKNYTALALEFDSLMLLPMEEISKDLGGLSSELEKVAESVLVYPKSEVSGEYRSLPYIKFDAIIVALISIARKFKFVVPPYFLNNARAIGSLEGMALLGK